MAYIDPEEYEQERAAELELEAMLRKEGMPDPEIRLPDVVSPHAQPEMALPPVMTMEERVPMPRGEFGAAMTMEEQAHYRPVPDPRRSPAPPPTLSVPMAEASPALAALAQRGAPVRGASTQPRPQLAPEAPDLPAHEYGQRGLSVDPAQYRAMQEADSREPGSYLAGTPRMTQEQIQARGRGFAAIATPDDRNAPRSRADMPSPHMLPPGVDPTGYDALQRAQSGEKITKEDAELIPHPELPPTRAQQQHAAMQALAGRRQHELAMARARHAPPKPVTDLDRAKAAEYRARAGKHEAMGQAAMARYAQRGKARRAWEGTPPPGYINAARRAYEDAGMEPDPTIMLQLENARYTKERDKALAAARLDIVRRRTAGARTDQQEASQRVVGWDRGPDAPLMGNSEMQKIREQQSELRNMNRINREMQELAKQITPADMVAARGGKDTREVAKARQLQRSMTTALRIAANMGVPSAQEMLIVNEQAPELQTIQGFLNAPHRYTAIAEDFGGKFTAIMQSRGYSRRDTGHAGQRHFSSSGGTGGGRLRLASGATVADTPANRQKLDARKADYEAL